MKVNELTGQVIGAAIEVHRELGPGKHEADYEAALAHELFLRGLPHQTQKPVPVVYKGVKLECGYRLDILVAGLVVLEVKSVELVCPVHRAQVLTYLKLGGWNIALLLNFNVAVLKQGIDRLVLGLDGYERSTLDQVRQSGRDAPCLRLANDSGDIEAERLAREVLAAAVAVHDELGPGLLASAYDECLCHELRLRGVPFQRSCRVALEYKGIVLPQADEVDMLVGGCLVVSPRALIRIEAVHEAQLLSQLRLGRWPLGLLINFNAVHLSEGLRRVVCAPRSGNSSRQVTPV